MAYNTTASLDELTCTDYVDIAKCQDMWTIFLVQNDSHYLDIELKVLKRDDNRDFCLTESLTIGEADFNQFMRLRDQLVSAAENFAREENFSLVPIPTKSKNMDEQLKLAHKLLDIVDGANRKICVTLLRYNVEKPVISYAQFRLFAS